jgi:hypothetical protein
MIINRSTRYGLLICAGIFFAVPGAARAGPRCAVIDATSIVGFAGKASGYALTRNGRPVPVLVFSPLRSGDRLKVSSPSGRLGIQLPDRKTRILRARDGEICIRRAAPATYLSRLVQSIGRALSFRQNELLGTLVGRGGATEPPEVVGGPLRLTDPALLQRRARIAGGQRQLAFAWRGGTAPFHLRITDPRGSLVLDEPGLDGHVLLKQASLRLAPGAYELRLTDAKNISVSAGFTAVAGQAPRPATAQEALIEAVGLAEGGAELNFDALLTLVPYFGSDETVDQLATYLMEGAERRPDPDD